MSVESLRSILDHQVFGNTLGAYLAAAGIFVGALIGLQIIKKVVVNRLSALAKQTTTDIDDFLVNLLQYVGPVVYVLVALYAATQALVLGPSLERAIRFFFVIVLTYKVVQILQAVAGFFLQRWVAKTAPEDPTSALVVRNLAKIIRFVLWVAAVLFVLDNLGVRITSMIAGLGIGGVALALASQAILGDAFSAFAVFIDKPFTVGDFIIVGDFLGTVEQIGFKTTRLRSLGGEQIAMSNTDLTNSRIRNYKRMEMRRVLFKLGVTYQTTAEQLTAIPPLIEAIIKEQSLAKFDRAHFASYGDFALAFEVVYYVLSADYNRYMDVQQAINLRIKEEFEQRGIEFAYPTQQLYVTQVELPQPRIA